MTLQKILLKSIIIPVVGVALTFFPSKSNAQFDPNKLPFNPKGFVLEEGISDNLDVYAYNTINNSLVAQTKTARTDTIKTITAGGDTTFARDVPGYFNFVIPTDLASTPDIKEGPNAGDELYFRIKKGNDIHKLDAINGRPVIHNPGQIERWDMQIGSTVAVEDPRNIPKQFSLYQNYPNPFNPTTTIRYSINESQHVSLEIIDARGRILETLVRDYLHPGDYEEKFDASEHGSGLYFVRMRAGKYIETRKMMLIK